MSANDGIDEDVGKGVRILSLDSGGPGTYSQLLIIKEYMARLANDLDVDDSEIYPADYFDLMGGVGFGGLVAILLGHIRMNVDDAIDAVLAVALAIFPHESPSKPDTEANTLHLTEAVKTMLQTRGISPDRKMKDKGEGPVGCKVALYAATTANLRHPIIFRTYPFRGFSLNPTIVEAICATIVTPSYFSPIKIGPPGRQQTFVGGPPDANNPTRELLEQASAIFGNEQLVSQIISIGCGYSRVTSIDEYTSAAGVSRLVQEMAMDCETVAKELSKRLFGTDAYLRLNVDRGMEDVPMDQWNDLGAIECHTDAYVKMAAVSNLLETSLLRLQESTGTMTLGQLNHPGAARDMQGNPEDSDRTFKSLKDYEDSRLLDRLKPIDAPSYEEDHSCMEGTRTALLDDIVAWALGSSEKSNALNRSNGDNIFWLYGIPGVGKTHVANSLCRRLHKTGNLGGTFFCRRDDPNLSEAKHVVPTLIYRLAKMWSPYRKLVAQSLREDPQLNPDTMGCQLLLKHLESLKEHPPRPLILVVDALDECGEPRTRTVLLNSLMGLCSRIQWLKVVVTSRHELDITLAFDKVGVSGWDLAVEKQVDDDIRLFVKDRMESVAQARHLQPDWPGEERLNQVVARSGGLFIFATTVCLLVEKGDPEEELNIVLTGESEEANDDLHKLYSAIIRSRIKRNKERFQSFARAFIVVASYRPLCDATLASLVGLPPRTVRCWVDDLSSLLYRDGTKNDGIRVRHLSVIDFFTGLTCPGEFRVDRRQGNAELGLACLITMMRGLKFNICGLETSYLSNKDIHDLEDRVRKKIPDELQYSCMYWSNHLCSDLDTASVEICGALGEFFVGEWPLYWLEVLGLMGKVPAAILALRQIKACIKACKFGDQHRDLIEDVMRFVLAFSTPISTSTPHLYLSALAFSPMESIVRNYARKSFPMLLDVCKGHLDSWPARPGEWKGHTKSVYSVAYSPDGQHVVSGSKDNTIRIWDAETGAAVGEPLRGHTNWVVSVAYSPDGQHVVSGSNDNTIRISDAETGAAVGEPLRRHTNWVLSVAYSPDGQHVVSGSSDSTIRIWDAETGAAVGEPLRGHTGAVKSVACSPDGQHVVSGSYDNTIRIWDAETGAAVGEPLRGHTNWVVSVAYSADGQHVVSGSSDNTIRIWDAGTGAAVGEPLRGHTDWVVSVAYSPDGQHVVSGSYDNTIRIWDAETGAAVGEPLRGHTGAVKSVAYSPDGQHVVSGSYDNTIRIWDAGTGAAAGEPLRRHTDWVVSVAYSPDGQHVVSGSNDNTIRIWDAETGAAVGEPLRGHTHWVVSVAYSPDGQHVVSGSYDNTIRIWDVETGAAVGEPLRGHTGGINSVAYSPDGHHIVSGSYDHTIRIWDAETRVENAELLLRHTSAANMISIFPNNPIRVPESRDLPPIPDATDPIAATRLSITDFSGLAIPAELLDDNGWVHDANGLLFWVPDDCRDGLTCPTTLIIPDSGRHRSVRLAFTRFRYGASWAEVYRKSA